ncbi:hypothetical protein L598_000700000970 [Mesorhizobium sp. J18]|uniref:hypothetical protein n=1 Tax=Mesorhizobium sp. J18 TaxID=935263 RepID=UPI001199A9AA|nr:hypothetical protein [Mesorhizobium sp. J18]TWG90340.1 hypothetical protein L598_000700000970 [Mesorhizobium sp. J18]
MNRATAFAEETIGGYIGRFRLAWRSEAFKVREHREGRVLYFATAEEAELAAWRVKHKIEDRHMRRDGETLSTAISAADALFPTLVRQKGSSRYTKVETRRQA